MNMRIINICFIYLLFGLIANASPFLSHQNTDNVSVKNDSTQVDLRSFSEEKINAFKKDTDFHYGINPGVKLNLFQRFLRWIFKWISKIGQFTAGTLWLRIVFYSILGLIIVYALLKLMGVDISRMFYRQIDKGNLPFDVLEENIHELDFEQLIEEAINQNEFKKTIRLYYLYALKKLSDQELIQWHPGKTNHAYQEELKVATIKPSFIDLGYYFDYAWYGDFPISQGLFVKVKSIFNDFKASVETYQP